MGNIRERRVLEDARAEEKLRAFKKYYLAVILLTTGLMALSGLMYLLFLLIPCFMPGSSSRRARSWRNVR